MNVREVKAARVRAGYSQADLAEKLGIASATYTDKESGRHRFTDEQKVMLTEIFGWTPQQMNDFFYDGILPIGSENRTW